MKACDTRGLFGAGRGWGEALRHTYHKKSESDRDSIFEEADKCRAAALQFSPSSRHVADGLVLHLPKEKFLALIPLEPAYESLQYFP